MPADGSDSRRSCSTTKLESLPDSSGRPPCFWDETLQRLELERGAADAGYLGQLAGTGASLRACFGEAGLPVETLQVAPRTVCEGGLAVSACRCGGAALDGRMRPGSPGGNRSWVERRFPGRDAPNCRTESPQPSGLELEARFAGLWDRFPESGCTRQLAERCARSGHGLDVCVDAPPRFAGTGCCHGAGKPPTCLAIIGRQAGASTRWKSVTDPSDEGHAATEVVLGSRLAGNREPPPARTVNASLLVEIVRAEATRSSLVRGAAELGSPGLQRRPESCCPCRLAGLDRRQELYIPLLRCALFFDGDPMSPGCGLGCRFAGSRRDSSVGPVSLPACWRAMRVCNIEPAAEAVATPSACWRRGCGLRQRTDRFAGRCWCLRPNRE